jgi:hypothetical protein
MSPTRDLPSAVLKPLAASLALAVLAGAGCQTAPSKTVKGAGTGAATGAVLGGIAGSASGSSGGAAQGLIAGGAAGAVIGGVIGLAQEMKERKEQDRLAQERAYQQELARKRADEAKARAELDEEIAIAEGFRISDLELNEAQKKVDNATGRLEKLRAERQAALQKKKSLDEAQERLLATEAEIARLEEELARLRGDTADAMGPGSQTSAPSTTTKVTTPPRS